MFDLSGRVALVTGAGQGVGAGIAHALAARGALVAVNDLDFQRAMTVATAIDPAGIRARPIVFDVTDEQDIAAGIEAIGHVDILVNNAGNAGAGVLTPKPFRQSSPEEWRSAIDVNLQGVMLCTRAVINDMCEEGWGRIITIASDAARIGVTMGVSAYAAGKGGAIAFMRHLAVENASYGVTANTISLGLMNTVDPTRNAAAIRAIPAGRLGHPDDAGSLAVYLASEESSWMTGQLLSLNGGQNTF